MKNLLLVLAILVFSISYAENNDKLDKKNNFHKHIIINEKAKDQRVTEFFFVDDEVVTKDQYEKLMDVKRKNIMGKDNYSSKTTIKIYEDPSFSLKTKKVEFNYVPFLGINPHSPEKKEALYGETTIHDFSNNQIIKGKIVDDERDGKWRYFDKNGKLIKVEIYKNGILLETIK